MPQGTIKIGDDVIINPMLQQNSKARHLGKLLLVVDKDFLDGRVIIAAALPQGPAIYGYAENFCIASKVIDQPYEVTGRRVALIEHNRISGPLNKKHIYTVSSDSIFSMRTNPPRKLSFHDILGKYDADHL